ncbi:hypothetical protein HA402_010446 [Bradysia odoriphaga]|nr:hypothetical protein HA402_010446 [Bradysia odoriphaga]
MSKLLLCLILVACFTLSQCDENGYCTSVAEQLMCFKTTQDHTKKGDALTTVQGQPIGDISNSKTVGKRGPVLLEDVLLLKETAQFNRERIPARVVHGKGAGAYGQLSICSNFLEKYSKAVVFRNGSSHPVFVRFSQATSEPGTPDTMPDLHGFAVKVKTDEGIWDLVGNNMPVFIGRDGRLFTSITHSQLRNPRTHIKDRNMAWDLLSLRNESTLFVLYSHSDLSTPASYRHMGGFGVHTFRLVNGKGDHFFARFNWKTDQGIKNLTMQEALKLTAQSPDYYIQDLYEAIAQGKYPTWTLTVQILTPKQAKCLHFNAFDATKVWFTDEIPEHEVGKLTLNRNQDNYFAEVEQSAFDPANMPPGIEPSPDKLLQARLFSYLDAQYYRLGINFNQLPVNRPINNVVANSYRDGFMVYENSGGMPNYNPNSFLKASAIPRYKESAYRVGSDVVDRHEQPNDNFFQATKLYESFAETDKAHLVENLAADLKRVFPFIRQRALRNLKAVSTDLEQRVQQMLNE